MLPSIAISFAIILALFSAAVGSANVEIELIVTPPPVTPGEATIYVASWSRAGEAAVKREIKPTRTGSSQLIEDFHSKVLNKERNLIVYLPPQYQSQPERSFPVLYMCDGQNLFDRSTSAFGAEWEADETAEFLISVSKVEPLILMGIYTEANRTDELTNSLNEKYKAGGKAPLFAQFLIAEVKPHIDQTYRTQSDRTHTGIGGSSLGGYFSLWLCEKYPEVFGKCAAVSPALLWNDGALVDRWADASAALPPARFWIDVGTRESVRAMPAGSYVAARQKLADTLHNRGADCRFVIDEAAEHNEAAWQKRFPQVLEFLFPPQ